MASKTVNLNAIEKWTIVNNTIFGHTFHLHDVFFNLISRSGGNTQTVSSYEQGWKDSFWLPKGGTASFIAKFDDYADSEWPYMYNCHALTHEDEGMMGPFTVIGSTSTKENAVPPAPLIQSNGYSLFPNPVGARLYINFEKSNQEIYYITITTIEGRVEMMLPKPDWKNGLNVTSLATGTYVLNLTDEKTKTVTVRTFRKK